MTGPELLEVIRPMTARPWRDEPEPRTAGDWRAVLLVWIPRSVAVAPPTTDWPAGGPYRPDDDPVGHPLQRSDWLPRPRSDRLPSRSLPEPRTYGRRRSEWSPRPRSDWPPSARSDWLPPPGSGTPPRNTDRRGGGEDRGDDEPADCEILRDRVVAVLGVVRKPNKPNPETDDSDGAVTEHRRPAAGAP